jgi:hypothetical protein
VTETGSVLDQLVATEGAVLLRPGMAFELAQLQSQIGHALRTLSKLLIDSDLSVVDVESQATARWGSRTLEGRLDLLLSGGFPEVVLDLKWGRKSYEDRLQKGLAIQLAVYAEARRGQTGSPILPLTAYYSLSRAQVLTTEPHAFVGVRSTSGPSTKETWQRVARTAELAERLIGEGRIAVTGVAHFTSLLEMASLPEADAPKHLTADAELACQYCSYGPLCGRSWEAYS